jgi:hypothetical protein
MAGTIRTLGVTASLLVMAAMACNKDDKCACPERSPTALIAMACPLSTPPTVVASGSCTVQAQGTEELVTPDSRTSASSCQVALTFADGTTATVSIAYGQEWLACGSDPHGCGQALVPTPAMTTLSNECADGGQTSD